MAQLPALRPTRPETGLLFPRLRPGPAAATQQTDCDVGLGGITGIYDASVLSYCAATPSTKWPRRVV